jgi:hypothetical protein
MLILSTKSDIAAPQEVVDLSVMNLWMPREVGISSQYE